MNRSTVALALLLGAASFASARAFAGDEAPSGAAPVPAVRSFATPQDAANALADAFEKNDDQALRLVLGAGSEDLVEKGSDPVVASSRKAMATDVKTKLGTDVGDDGRVTLLLGDEGWPFPIPLLKVGERYTFDVAAGREEVLARQIGRHELEVIGLCRTYVDLQAAYAAKDRDDDEVREYAQRILSSEGKHDGLYWPDSTDDDPSPLGVALVPLKSAGQDARSPYAGYFWRILKGQGAEAPGGAHSYVINGNMIAGFALVAVPAEYGKTGIMTFLVSHHGKVFQKDLGEKSLDVARAMDVYDPDETWTEVKPGEEILPAGGASVAPLPGK
ncbi:MAG: DUF2950 domain-containing protein [Planctomycetota bacterium]